jgi:hypothetical protein
MKSEMERNESAFGTIRYNSQLGVAQTPAKIFKGKEKKQFPYSGTLR